MLEDAYRADGFKNALTFTVCDAEQMVEPASGGITLFLYRIAPDASSRNRSRPEKGRQTPPLCLELNFLITSWGRDVVQEQRILGWVMMTLNEHPVLSAAKVNAAAPDVFEPDETVEIACGEMGADEMARLWDSLGSGSYRLSVPYVARGVRLG
jgi:hypothetical protein